MIGLLAAALGSAVTGSLEPLIFALGAETVYLTFALTIPGLFGKTPFTRYPQRLLQDLSESQVEHFLGLCRVKDQILDNYRKLPGGRILAASSESRLDGLLDSFHQLLSALNDHREFVFGADAEAIEKELDELAKGSSDEPADLKEVKARRAEILGQRLAKVRQARTSRELISHHLAAIEDLIKLTYEQSITLRDPEAVSRQLEALTQERNATDESLRELVRFQSLTEGLDR